MDDHEKNGAAASRFGEEPPPASPRQEHRSDERWSHPASPLQAARFALRRTRAEVVTDIRQLCPGHHGRPCLLDAAKLAHYEHNQRLPGPTHVAAFARYYNKNLKELGLSTPNRQPAAGSVTTDPAGSADVLSGLLTITLDPDQLNAGTGAGVADVLVRLAHTDQRRLAATTINNRQLQRLELAVDQHTCGYYQLTRLPRVRALLTDWTTARNLLEVSQTPSQRTRLTRSYAALTGILGALAFDHGHPERARALLDAAQDAARESRHTDLYAWCCEQQAMLADWDQDPKRVLVRAGHGLHTAGDAVTPAVARLHARAAAAHASMGNHALVTKHLTAAEEVVSNPKEGCWPLLPGLPRAFTFTPDSLATTAARCHLRLGEHPEAITRAREATSLQHEHGLSGKTALGVALNQLRLAAALARTGELEEATQVATTTVQDYQGVAAPLLLRRARELEHELTAIAPDSPHVREFAEVLHTQPHSGVLVLVQDEGPDPLER